MWDGSGFGNASSERGGKFPDRGRQFLSPPAPQGLRSGPSGGGRKATNVVPLVVQQILNSKTEEFKLFGMSVQIAHLVGILRNFEVSSTKATCLVQDHTGAIRCILWLEHDNDGVPDIPIVKEGSYVEIFGSIRHEECGKIIMIVNMKPVTDCNIINTHLLEVLSVRRDAEAYRNKQRQLLSHTPATVLANSISEMEVVTENASSSSSSANNPCVNKTQQKVFDIVKMDKDERIGLGRAEILKHFPPNQHREVTEALDFLINEGHIYTTVDEFHFKATNSY